MKRFQLLAIVFVMSLLLVALIAVSGLAQAPGADPEPNLPLYSLNAEGSNTQSSGASSQPVASDDSVAPVEVALEITEGQRNSSAPILPDGSVAAPSLAPPAPERLPEGIDAITAIADSRVTGTALKPRGNDVDYIPTSGGGCFYASAGNSSRVFNTGIYLPQDSNVLALRMYYDDTSSSDSRGWFTIYDLYGNIVQEWSVDSAGNSGNGFNDTVEISHTIDYGSYSYALNWRPYDLGSDTQLCGFRIFYEPQVQFGAFMPTIRRNYP